MKKKVPISFTYRHFLSLIIIKCERKAVYPSKKTVTSVTVTTVTIFAQNQRSLVEVKGAARLLALSSVMCWDIKRADNAVRLHIKSSDAAKRCIARPAKNRYGVCEGKVQY